MQQQFWQQAITAPGTAGGWCENKYEETEDLYKDRSGLYLTLLRAAQLADIHVINEAKESERDVKLLVKNDIQ